VRDIAPGSDGSVDNLVGLTEPVALGGGAVFVANDGTHGAEPWFSDGTAFGTHLIKDVNPGNAYETIPSQRWDAATIGGTLLFAANDGVHGAELWRTDGTEAGTQLVRDIAPGTQWSFPQQLTAAGDVLFFRAGDGSSGPWLWRSDGTAEGTIMVSQVPEPFDLAAFGRGVAFFSYDPERNRYFLWTSDGNADGTLRVGPDLGNSIAPDRLVRASERETPAPQRCHPGC
jgi:ELWxxDGT repeat protein